MSRAPRPASSRHHAAASAGKPATCLTRLKRSSSAAATSSPSTTSAAAASPWNAFRPRIAATASIVPSAVELPGDHLEAHRDAEPQRPLVDVRVLDPQPLRAQQADDADAGDDVHGVEIGLVPALEHERPLDPLEARVAGVERVADVL